MSSEDSFSRLAGAASRFKPRSAVEFHPPIVGPSGAALVSYEWAWTMGEKEHATEGLIPKRVSDWDRAEASGVTGRDLVHQYSVRLKDGEHRIVSAETVPSVLGFTLAMSKDPEGVANFKSVASSLKKYGQLQMELAPVSSRVEENTRIHAEVLASLSAPDPVIAHELPGHYFRENAQWVKVGDGEPATLWVAEKNSARGHERQAEVCARAAENWYEKRAVERGADTHLRAGLIRMEANDIVARIGKMSAKLEKISGSKLSLSASIGRQAQEEVLDEGFAKPAPFSFEGLDDLSSHIAAPKSPNPGISPQVGDI